MKDPQQTVTIFRKDYVPLPYQVKHVHLEFDIGMEKTRVLARLALERKADAVASAPLELNGSDLELHGLFVDGCKLAEDEYSIEGETLLVHGLPERCVLEIQNSICPDQNTALEGLYRSGEFLLTQCEAEGFRKITWYPDRPDVMAEFDVLIRADKERFPVLLSNGNCIDEGEMGDGRHFAHWQDPFPKPSYLFALVAGDLAYIEDFHTTPDGRRVALRIYTEHRNIDRCDHAMRCLQAAMRWDEERFRLNYDLDIYNIVVTDDFNMGAMENKSLNIFNSVYVLASPETATDTDFINIEAVIGHEYFHNWTGNRITCRDWFQLSLKEGLTVFRDQEFTADLHSRDVKRIEDVAMLRANQFAEDAGGMSHPVRPDSYEEISNFYTLTIYEKGAEVVRMYHTLLGEEGFQKGMDLYFQRHDGQAVTCDDFRRAMADANEVDLEQFELWYSQAGTPRVEAVANYDADTQSLELVFKQEIPDTPGQQDKKPMHIPVLAGLLDKQGNPMVMRAEGESEASDGSRLLELREASETFRFTGLPEAPRVSLLRQFSAPVKLDFDYSVEDLAFLMAHDDDAFNRWEAGQRLARMAILGSGNKKEQATSVFLDAFGKVLADERLDLSLAAEMLSLPSSQALFESVEEIDPLAIHEQRRELRNLLAEQFHDRFLEKFEQHGSKEAYRFDGREMARRKMHNLSLSYLAGSEGSNTITADVYRKADNMTDRMAALGCAVHWQMACAPELLADFEQRWLDNPLVMDKWFRIQSTSPQDDCLEKLPVLMQHSAFNFKNPNKVRAVLGSFSRLNVPGFHGNRGDSYRFMAEKIVALDQFNPQIAARLATCFSNWKHYSEPYRSQMKETLAFMNQKTLSGDTAEIIGKALKA